MILKISRLYEIKGTDGYKFQTIGRLDLFDDTGRIFSCHTLERPWLDNKKNVSCIPPAPNETKTYKWIKLNSSPSFAYAHLWLKDVPNRTYIKMHVANSYDDLQGCIAVGNELVYLEGDDVVDVVGSRDTLSKLMSLVPDKGEITIKNQVDQQTRVPSIDVVDYIDKLADGDIPELSEGLSFDLEDYVA